MMDVFNRLESEVRSYCRLFPAIFARARGAHMVDRDGREYLDFFAGAGSLNYGHNPPEIKRALLAYLEADGLTHGLDMATEAKEAFLERFESLILQPRGLDYKLQFPGPTGTNAVEAAIKLARKVTGRTTVVSFTNAFHGMTLGALALTGNRAKRAAAGVPLGHSAIFPYDGYLGSEIDTLDLLAAALEDPSSGLDLPAAVIVETVQAEGGVRVARLEWLRRLADLLKRHQVLLIVDDIQVGCGRTGPFFSFEAAGLAPDLVCLSKSISGYGLPMALVLLRPELDHWAPGEHNGTFRGHNLAFVTATAALEHWRDDELSRAVGSKARRVAEALAELAREHPALSAWARGRGLIQGLEIGVEGLASAVSREAFARGLILETCGARDEVLKLLPPLTIAPEELERGLGILGESLAAVTEGKMALGPALPQEDSLRMHRSEAPASI